MNWFRHAFALDPPGSSHGQIEPTAEERAVVDRLCGILVRRRMTLPAVTFLEMSRPLNRIAAQALYFFQPVASLALTGDDYNRFARFLEKSGSIEYLCRRLEDLAADATDSPTTAPPEPSATESDGAAAVARE
ncbi:MAG TPA: hypothetical protein VFG04_29285 [Planctomycetaceae bacterium]|jgi:hypothetical protein|nr:hypothetical protein [Planctomycetaceae bacterium]